VKTVNNNIKKMLSIIFMLSITTAITYMYLQFFSLEKPAVEMNKITVVIDSGHGGIDKGCLITGQIYESDITGKVAQKLAEIFEKQGIQVRITGDNSFKSILMEKFYKNNNLDKRIEYVNKSSADFFISLHINSSPKKGRAGAVVYYNEDNQEAALMTEKIQNKLTCIPEMVKRTSIPGNYYILNKLNIPAVLIEMGYASNEKEKKYLINEEYQNKIADAVAGGFLEYLHDCKDKQNKEINNCNNSYHQECINNSFMNVYLISESKTRFFMISRELADIDKNNCSINDTIRMVLKELIISSMPQGIDLRCNFIADSCAEIDIITADNKLIEIGSEEEKLIINSIACTLFEIPEIQKLQFLVNGEKRNTLAGHIDISRPLTRDKLMVTKVKGGIIEGKKAKIAVTIDDFGQFNKEGVKEMFSIEKPLTFAVMPGLENSVVQAIEAANKGFEVIVHLPMQSRNGKASWLGPGAITVNMTPEEIYKQVKENFEKVPYAAGFNNHMGDMITVNDKLIKPVMEAAKEMDFFVLDSRTTDKTKVIELAKSLGIPYAKRDVFLDDYCNEVHIEKQLKLLAEKALANGSAIGIGHVGFGRKKTAKIIKKMIPYFESQGIEFVYLSDLIN
jgi:hypothetical protein